MDAFAQPRSGSSITDFIGAYSGGGFEWILLLQYFSGMFAQILAWILACVPTGPGFNAEGRLGLRLSPGDVSPQLGATAEIWRIAGTFEGWIRPFRWTTTIEESPMVVSKYKELRYGTSQGIRLRVLGEVEWLALAAGTEWITGDWSGTIHRPESQVVPWVGLELHAPGRWGRVRFCTESNRNGRVRLEFFQGFRTGDPPAKGGSAATDHASVDSRPPPEEESVSTSDSSATDSTRAIHGPGDQP